MQKTLVMAEVASSLPPLIKSVAHAYWFATVDCSSSLRVPSVWSLWHLLWKFGPPLHYFPLLEAFIVVLNNPLKCEESFPGVYSLPWCLSPHDLHTPSNIITTCAPYLQSGSTSVSPGNMFINIYLHSWRMRTPTLTKNCLPPFCPNLPSDQTSKWIFSPVPAK